MNSRTALHFIQSVPHVHKRIISAERYQDIYYKYGLKEVAHVTRIFKRGKVESEHITILEDGEKLIKEEFGHDVKEAKHV